MEVDSDFDIEVYARENKDERYYDAAMLISKVPRGLMPQVGDELCLGRMYRVTGRRIFGKGSDPYTIASMSLYVEVVKVSEITG